MKRAILALFAMLWFRCAAVPPSQPFEQDPSNPKASEAPLTTPSRVLAEDPPPAAAFQDAAVSGETQGDGGSADPHQQGQMAMPEQGQSEQTKREGHQGRHGMGTPDSGAGTAEPRRHQAGMDGGAP